MIWKNILTSGLGLTMGSTAINALPQNAASAGVQKGMGNMGSFYPMIGTLGGANMTMKQLKKLKEGN